MRTSAEYAALTRGQRQDIRASQRTFEGAYIRTAFSKLTFGLLILRLFAKEFLPLGIVYIASALLTTGLVFYRRSYGEKTLIEHPSTYFDTAGNIVALTAVIDLCSFTALLVLLTRL